MMILVVLAVIIACVAIMGGTSSAAELNSEAKKPRSKVQKAA